MRLFITAAFVNQTLWFTNAVMGYVYEFLDLAYTNPVGPRSYETQTYITNTLEKEGKQIYLYSYINE